ncbi:MAG: tRNA (adenosine(37)-N6)-threonylcarbamoyltransferase complex transferase subunit TsaD [Candidatus Woesebacteria bacterium]|nr:MAG: tRNA (adenosine(37)-N6)-threonylcarbamoyltransferase complex transferase subunit TsaD [Candidatus Woesebacteria bacterium]
MKILGIETSCDETACAIIEDGTKIISNVVASSALIQAKFGGVIPERAAREQIKSMIPVLEEAMTPLRQDHDEIEAIAVTIGPGLIGSLLVGIETARVLSYLWEKPVIPVNHLVGHIYANFLETYKNPEFPILVLVVSGGHTDLVWMGNHGKIKWIGGTRDDAAGEAFDKCARLLGLSYPGGPSISKEALKNKSKSKLDLFPRPMINEQNYDWSFSGLKTAVAREIQKCSPSELKLRRVEFAAQIQEAIVDSLVIKTVRAIEDLKPKSFLLAGGVAANQRLKEKFSEKISKLENVEFFVPEPSLCTDNAAYIASAAYFNNKKVDWRKINAIPELTITSEI